MKSIFLKLSRELSLPPWHKLKGTLTLLAPTCRAIAYVITDKAICFSKKKNSSQIYKTIPFSNQHFPKRDWMSFAFCNKILYSDQRKDHKKVFLFASLWLCEYGFFALTEIKTKKQKTLLGIDDKMWMCMATFKPQSYFLPK